MQVAVCNQLQNPYSGPRIRVILRHSVSLCSAGAFVPRICSAAVRKGVLPFSCRAIRRRRSVFLSLSVFLCSSCGPPSFFSGYRKSQAFPPGFCSLNISQTECKQKASNVKFCKLLTSKKPRFPHRYAGFSFSKLFFSKPRRVSLWPIAATSRRLPQSVPSSCRLYSGGAGLCAGPLSVRF